MAAAGCQRLVRGASAASYVRVSEPAPTPICLEDLAVDLSLGIGMLRRRLRAETDTGQLNVSQLGALVRIEQKGWITTAELARAESMKPQSMGSIVSRLEEAALVCRRPHPTDRRQVEFGLTPLGLETSRKRRMARTDWLVAALDRMTGSQQKTLLAAAALIKHLGQAG